MRCKLKLQIALLCPVVWCLLNPISLHAQSAFEKELVNKMDSFFTVTETVAPAHAMLFPNDAPSGVMVPSGWGGFGTYIFGGIGGAYPEVYHSSKADLIASAGGCIGNPIKAINVAAGINMTDVHRFRDFSGNIIISRNISQSSSISAGGLQLFAQSRLSDAPGSTFFIAFSHSVQTVLSRTPGCSGLGYTIGIGTGRFLNKSIKDIAAGKGKYGTAIFGSISYEIFRHANLSAEWNGMNLGFSLGVRPFKNALSFGVGVANLTGYSSDKPNMVFTIGYPLSLNR